MILLAFIHMHDLHHTGGMHIYGELQLSNVLLFAESDDIGNVSVPAPLYLYHILTESSDILL